MIGQTISHYTILEKLGQGGMGVVYKARDTQLDRDVALKFLPQDLAVTDEERARFVREAKAASALDHPNICTIYETGETPAGQMFIVMGYYKGTTLNQRLEKGRLDLGEAISIAIQAAEGLQAAHENQIVHRDIKSSNLMVTGKGLVKILDFGLAHRSGSSKLTKTGSTLGTASYMSPEQARGESLDHRSDLWSLGVVLYEMVTGQLPFRGGHDMAILYSVVNEEPRPIQELVPDAPAELVHIIGRALEKDPAERYQSAGDLLIDLRRLKKDTSRTGFTPVSIGKQNIPRFRKKVLVAFVILLASILATAGYFFFTMESVEINPDHSLRWMNVPFNTLGSAPAITPDGKWVVFGAQDNNKRWDMYAVSISGGEPRRVTHDSTDWVEFPDISPDGMNIVYNQVSGTTYNICVAPFNGGVSRKVGVGNQPLWSPDGSRIGFVLDPTELGPNPYQPSERARSTSGNGEFWTMKVDGSGATLQFSDTVAAKSYSNVFFAWSPDGGAVAWSRRALRNGQEIGEVVVHDLSSHTENIVFEKGTSVTNICWAANNTIIFRTKVGDEKSLWMVSADGGSPVRITKGLASVGDPKISADGKTLIFLQYKIVGRLWLAKLDGSGDKTQVNVEGEPWFSGASISPDGQYITSVILTLGGALVNQVFIFKRDGTDLHQISTGEDFHWWPTWSPDGTKIFYYARAFSDQYKSFRIYVANVPKFDPPRFIASGDAAVWVDSVTLELRDQNKMWRVFLDGRPREQFSEDSIWAQTSRDGKYVFFQDNHQSARANRDPIRWCNIEDWDGVGPKDAKAWPLTEDDFWNFNGTYFVKGSDVYRMSFPEMKMVKVSVNIEDRDPMWSGFRTTRDGWEVLYSSIEPVRKIGVIENLFK